MSVDCFSHSLCLALCCSSSSGFKPWGRAGGDHKEGGEGEPPAPARLQVGRDCVHLSPQLSSACLAGITVKSFIVRRERNGGAAHEILRDVWKRGGRERGGGGGRKRQLMTC